MVSGGCRAQVMATQEAAAPYEVALVVGTEMASGAAADAAGEAAGGVAGEAVADPLQDQVAVFGDPRGRILLREKPEEDGFSGECDMDVLQTGTLVYVYQHDGAWARVRRRDGGVEGWIRRKHLARDSAQRRR